MNTLPRITSLLLMLLMASPGQAETDNHPPPAVGLQPSYEQGQQWLQQRLAQRQAATADATNTARNLVLFLGDGMSVTTLTAARILQGQRQGLSGEENQLSFERFPYSALVKTYNTNQQTPDSAGTMSAITTGVKTRSGHIAIGPEQDRGICQGSEQHQQQTLFQWAHQQGYATGIVTTARITHATPAALYAHSPERDWEADSDLTREARQHGCQDIAWQLIHKAFPAGLDLAFGGGADNFSTSGKRDRGELVQAWQQQFRHGLFIENAQQLRQADLQQHHPLLGLFSAGHFRYQHDADDSQPTLAAMTSIAQTYLQQLVNRQQLKGYLLVVEGARIDHGHHLGNAYRALDETIELAKAVSRAERNSDDATLLLVTADHSHTLSMAGYPERGNDILGFTVNSAQTPQGPVLASDNHPYTTLGYANSQGGSANEDHQQRQPGRIHWHQPQHQHTDPTDADFYQAALGEYTWETHGADDVALHAKGPGAALFQGLFEQHEIYHRIRQAMQEKP